MHQDARHRRHRYEAKRINALANGFHRAKGVSHLTGLGRALMTARGLE